MSTKKKKCKKLTAEQLSRVLTAHEGEALIRLGNPWGPEFDSDIDQGCIMQFALNESDSSLPGSHPYEPLVNEFDSSYSKEWATDELLLFIEEVCDSSR